MTRRLTRLIPENDLGDAFFFFLHFVSTHRRLPTGRPLINDYLFRLMLSREAKSPLRGYVSDKEFVKQYVSAKVGDEFNVPTLEVFTNLEEALEYEFPRRCCIKPTHLSGFVILRENGEDIDFRAIAGWFSTNYYRVGRERNYRYLTPKLIAEPLIFDRADNEDLKFWCYKGRAKFVQVDIGRGEHHTRLYFDRDWRQQDWSILKPMSEQDFEKPKNFQALLSLADRLSADFEFVRVDLYTDGQKIFVGELTNWPENGMGCFVPRDAEARASRLLFEERT